MKKITATLLMLTVLAPACGVAQTMYKCVQDGKTAYQSEPCANGAKQDIRKPRTDASASKSASASASAAPAAEVNHMIELMSTYKACADAITMWRNEMAEPYDIWRSHNLPMISRIESDPQLQALFQQRVDAKRNGKAGMCREAALEIRGVNK